jgi:hypothetical protein
MLTLLEGGAEHLVPDLARTAPSNAQSVGKHAQQTDQLGLFGQAEPHVVVKRLRTTDVNALTPLVALQLIADLVDEAKA